MSEQHSKIPKGTKVYVYDYTSRRVTIDGDGIDNVLQKTVTVNAQPAVYADLYRFGGTYYFSCAVKDALEAWGYPLETPVVTWGPSDAIKVVLASDVTAVEPIVRKESTEPRAIPFKNQLVAKTEWTVKTEVEVRRHRRVPGTSNLEYESYVVDRIPVGAVLKVVKKQIDYGQSYWAKPDDFKRDYVIVQVNGGKDQVGLHIDHLKDKVELATAVTEHVFVLFDPVTKEYYQEAEYLGYDPTTWVRDYQLVTNSKLTKAKKFKRLNDVRVHCLIQSGYYDDLPSGWGDLPEWMCQSKAFDIPRSWVIHKYEKVSKTFVEEYEMIDTFDRSWRLRELTVKYGSAIRQVYSDLEKKDQLSEYQAVLAFNKKEEESTNYYRYSDELSPSELQEIKDVIDVMDKKTIRVTKSSIQSAIAMKDVDSALLVKLAYTGDLNIVILDLQTMTESLEK